MPVGDTSCDKGLLVVDLTTVNKDSDFDLIWGESGPSWESPDDASGMLSHPSCSVSTVPAGVHLHRANLQVKFQLALCQLCLCV